MQVFAKKHAQDQQKSKWPLKLTEYAEKMQYRHLPIQEHLVYSHLKCMYMIVNVHICTIYRAYIYMYMYIYIMPFLEVTILFNQHFIIVENIVGKFRTGILTLFI